jgi:hypothetical protein
MSIFTFFGKHNKSGDGAVDSRADNRPERDGAWESDLTLSDDFSIFHGKARSSDNYLFNGWVNIAVSILIRNIARADFSIKKGGMMYIRALCMICSEDRMLL